MQKIDWVTTLFLIITPVLAVALIPIYVIYFEWNPWTMVLALVYWGLSSMAITAGYHRLYAHRSYDATAWFKLLVLFFGAGSYQGSALKWCSDHRRHHRRVDTDEDPYSIKKGFWYAHVGWLFLKESPEYKGKFAPDLENDKWVKFQHDHYLPISIVAGFGLPIILGLMYGDAIGAFVFVAVTRIVLAHHTTFFINSLAHIWGRQTYNDRVSARDNHIIAFLTNGEGFHNFHHTFEADYRNGVKWYHWDPTKWLIRTMSFLGQTYRLQRSSPSLMLRLRLQMEQKRLVCTPPSYQEKLNQMRMQVERAQKRWRELKEEYAQMKKNFSANSQERLVQMKAEISLAKIEFKRSLQQWSVLVRALRRMREFNSPYIA